MQCATKFEFGLFGAILFLAVVIGSAIFTPLSDIIGRRYVLLIGMVMQFVFSVFLLFTHDRNIAYFLVFMIGLDFGARKFVGFIYIMEFLTASQTRQMTQIVTALDRLCLTFASFYFQVVSKSWTYLHVIQIMLAAISIYLIMNLPESPKFLVKKGKIKEAQSALQKMAETNKVKFDFDQTPLVVEESI